MHILVAGHSFIRRLAFDAKVRGLDLVTGDNQVTMIGKGGATIVGHKTVDREVHCALRDASFDLLVLDLGSNDLDPLRHPDLNTAELARSLVNKAEAMAFRYKITVVLCLPIPRAERLFPNSFDITDRFNSEVKTLVEGISKVKTWAHKGLFKRDDRYLDKHGVHLNSKGTIKYFHSIRAAIKFHSGNQN